MQKAMLLLVVMHMVSMAKMISIPEEKYLEMKRKAEAFEDEEFLLVNRGIKHETEEMLKHPGRNKSLAEVKKKYGL
ncbi:MAG: hypothetical protein NUV57_02425 [archaeon]|nr:hypothetical protein [archaeon]